MALDLVYFKKSLTFTRHSTCNEKTFYFSKNKEGDEKESER